MSTARRAASVLSLAGLLALVAAPVAAATPRFANPTGTGSECTQMAPCAIDVAINSAKEGDDVTIEPGAYGPLNVELEDNGEALNIHGQAGARPPTIVSNAEYAFEIGGKTTLSGVAIEDSVGKYGFKVLNEEARVSHVLVHVSAPEAIACYPRGALTDSVCWSSGTNGIAATVLISGSASSALRNDTLIASGAGGVAVQASGISGSYMRLSLANTIAQGTGADILAKTDSEPESEAVVTAEHSNYSKVQVENGGGGSRTIVTPAGAGTNRTAAPQFVGPTTGDFTERGASPTVDAGENSPLDGETDLDGHPRALPGSFGCGTSPPAITDVGAYEYVPPVPTCVATLSPTARISKARIDRRAGRVTFVFSAVGGPTAGFQCRFQMLNPKGGKKKRKNPSFSGCRSPKVYKHLKPGNFRFEVRALDGSGTPTATARKKLKLQPPPKKR